jgi:hypothetical protein
MPLAKVLSCAVVGLEGEIVECEVDVSRRGSPATSCAWTSTTRSSPSSSSKIPSCRSYARIPAIVLYVYRAVGVVPFETTDTRVLLFVFPNLFENWWLYVVIVARFFPRLYPNSLKSVAIPMILLLIPKMGQEYLLHYQEAEPWDWPKHHLLHLK